MRPQIAIAVTLLLIGTLACWFTAPLVEFFNPFALLVLPALYGSGAILIRELRVRWRKGWPDHHPHRPDPGLHSD